MSRYLTWEGGIRHEHASADEAREDFCRLKRAGIPCSLYLDGECRGAANGASDVVNWEAPVTPDDSPEERLGDHMRDLVKDGGL